MFDSDRNRIYQFNWDDPSHESIQNVPLSRRWLCAKNEAVRLDWHINLINRVIHDGTPPIRSSLTLVKQKTNQKNPWNLEAAVGRGGETILAAHHIPKGVLCMISTIRFIAGYVRKSSSMKCSVIGSLEVTPSIPRLSLMLWMSGTKGFYRKFSIVFRWFCCCRRRTKLFIFFNLLLQN